MGRWGNTLMKEMGEHIDEGDGGTHGMKEMGEHMG